LINLRQTHIEKNEKNSKGKDFLMNKKLINEEIFFTSWTGITVVLSTARMIAFDLSSWFGFETKTTHFVVCLMFQLSNLESLRKQRPPKRTKTVSHRRERKKNWNRKRKRKTEVLWCVLCCDSFGFLIALIIIIFWECTRCNVM